MFLNSKGSENAADPDIAAFLRYVDGKAPEGEFVRSVDQEVQRVKGLEKVRREYMILSDEIRRRQEEARIEGRTEGQYAIVKRMLKRGRSIQKIVDDTGVSEAEVRKLAEEM